MKERKKERKKEREREGGDVQCEERPDVLITLSHWPPTHKPANWSLTF